MILTLSCQDRPGIVAAISTALFRNGANILDAQQYDDLDTGRFFMRVVVDPAKVDEAACARISKRSPRSLASSGRCGGGMSGARS